MFYSCFVYAHNCTQYKLGKTKTNLINVVIVLNILTLNDPLLFYTKQSSKYNLYNDNNIMHRDSQYNENMIFSILMNNSVFPEFFFLLTNFFFSSNLVLSCIRK